MSDVVPLSLLPSLENVCVIKILGVLFNVRLTWPDHFEFIVRKLSLPLYVLKILKPLFSHDKLVLVFSAFILSVIDYASPVFLNCLWHLFKSHVARYL